MRIFKFRVWSKIKKKFIPSHKGEGLLFGVNGPSTDEEFEELGGWDLGSCIQDNSLVVQQFTGVHDSDGVDIYEGDIVQGLFLDTDNHHWKEATAPVVWNDNTCGFNISTNTWDRLTIKVVGNIFENENN